jgi:hypothetical protein
MQANGKAKLMTGTSGLESETPFAIYDPDSSSWRTSALTFPWGSGEWSATWPRSGTTRSGRAYELPMLAHHIDASACSSSLPTGQQMLPTPAVNDMGARKTVEKWDSWTEDMKAKHKNGNGHGRSLAIEILRLTSEPGNGALLMSLSGDGNE